MAEPLTSTTARAASTRRRGGGRDVRRRGRVHGLPRQRRQAADRLGRPARGARARSSSEYRSRDGSNYDCLIPVSGGKDSHYQTYVITQEFGLRPLLVTYHGNNYLPEGQRNLRNLRERFGCDHVFFSPSVEALKKMNRLCFRMMGDMNWHAHCGIFTYPIQVAVQQRIPLIIWGEHGFTDLAGMFSLNDRDRDDGQVPARARPARLRLARHDRGERGPRPRRICCGRGTRPTRRSPTSACAASTSATTSTGRRTPRPSMMIRDWGFEQSPSSRSSAPTAACRTSTTCTRTASTTT